MKKLLLFLLGFTCWTFTAQNQLQLLKGFDTVEPSNKSIAELASAYKIIAESPIFLNSKKEKLNNCENRAEYSSLVLSKLGFKPVDFWLLKEGLVEPQYDTPRKVKNSDPLCYTPVSSTDVLGCWGYHVAAGVQIEVDGQAQIMIIDPWTQGKLTTLNEWALSFFAQKSGRTAYVFPVKDNYKFYGSNGTGQISYSKKDWEENLDDDNNQLYCGLCGITPNEKCEKKKFGKEISDKRAEIQAYLKTHGIEL